MFIFQRLNQHRRDFTARYRCEFCGAEHTGKGYDDDNFHSNVIPAMTCSRCGRYSGRRTSEPLIPAHVTL